MPVAALALRMPPATSCGTSIEFRPTLQAQHDDAKAKGQQHRADLFAGLLTRLTEDEVS